MEKENKSSPEAATSHSALAMRLGEWAHAHRDTFLSPSGSLVFRNATKILVGFIPTAALFTGLRYGFKSYNRAEHLADGIHRPLKKLARNKLFQDTIFVFTGFGALRIFSKAWQRQYDRIFNHSADSTQSIEAIENLPATTLHDLKEIIPAEVAGTAVAAFPLAAIKGGFKHLEGPLEGNLLQARKGFVNDWLASIPAYSVFFETTERIYDSISKGKDSPNPPSEQPSASGKRWRFFTEDGLGRLAFRRIGSVTLGMAPYMGLMRYSKATLGEVKPGVNGLLNNVMKEYASYAGFATYTTLSELYTKAYDDLFKKLEAKQQEK